MKTFELYAKERGLDINNPYIEQKAVQEMRQQYLISDQNAT